MIIIVFALNKTTNKKQRFVRDTNILNIKSYFLN